MKFEIDYIEQLAEIVAKNDLTEICLKEGDKAITVRKEKEVITQIAQGAPVQTSRRMKKHPLLHQREHLLPHLWLELSIRRQTRHHLHL